LALAITVARGPCAARRAAQESQSQADNDCVPIAGAE
jgi:hypothetical protein